MSLKPRTGCDHCGGERALCLKSEVKWYIHVIPVSAFWLRHNVLVTEVILGEGHIQEFYSSCLGNSW